MCVRTQRSDPAQTRFWLKCPPNDEEVEKFLKIKFFGTQISKPKPLYKLTITSRADDTRH